MLSNNDLQKIGNLIDQRITTSEEKMSKRLEETESKIIRETGRFVAEQILPQIDDKPEKHVTDRLDNRLDHLADKASDHENRIKQLENKTPLNL